MARDDLHFRLRIPEDLKTRVEAAALANDRSMTAEIVARLQWTFGPADEEMTALLAERDEMAARVNELQRVIAELSHSLRTREQEVAALTETVADLDRRRAALYDELQARVTSGIDQMLVRLNSIEKKINEQ